MTLQKFCNLLKHNLQIKTAFFENVFRLVLSSETQTPLFFFQLEIAHDNGHYRVLKGKM